MLFSRHIDTNALGDEDMGDIPAKLLMVASAMLLGAGLARAEPLFNVTKAYPDAGGWTVFYSEGQNACIAEREHTDQSNFLATRGARSVIGRLFRSGSLMLAMSSEPPVDLAVDDIAEFHLSFFSGDVVDLKMIGFDVGGKRLALAAVPPDHALTAALMGSNTMNLERDGKTVGVYDLEGLKDAFAAIESCTAENRK